MFIEEVSLPVPIPKDTAFCFKPQLQGYDGADKYPTNA